MITIDLEPRGAAAAAIPFGLRTEQALGALLDRCDEENIRDVVLRLPAAPSEDLEAMLHPVLARRFRFSAWFRALPTARLADLFISAGHRITVAVTASPDGRGLHDLLKCPALAAGAPGQVGWFIALPAPPPNLAEWLEGLEPCAGITFSLGLAWSDPETGPSPLPPLAERQWVEALMGMAAWATRRGVTLRLACGLPLCLFSTEQLGELALSKVHPPLAVCAPGLWVALDGRARACPRLPADGWTAVPAGVPLRELAGQLIRPAEFFAAFCGRAEERACRGLSTGACGGGCIAHNALSWQGVRGE